MTAQEPERRPLDPRAVSQMAGGVQALQTHLSEDAVRDLARDVIGRMAGGAAQQQPDGAADTDVVPLCRALLATDSTEAIAMIDAERRKGAELEDIYLHNLTPAARLLGQWWEEDTLSFASVTIGISRIYAIVHALRADQAPRPSRGTTRRAVFASVPGDDHTLGVRLAADLFRDAGWDIDLQLDRDHADIVDCVAGGTATLVGLSASGQKALPALVRLILDLRVARPDVLIFVGGHIVAGHDGVIDRLGVDGAAADFAEARTEMDRLYTLSLG